MTESQADLDFVIALNGAESDEVMREKNLTVQIRQKGVESREFMIRSLFNNAKLTVKQPKLWWPNGIG